jgi:hypothetical protein
VVWVVERGGQRVMKYRHRLIERDAVLPAVAFGFRAIPFEMNSLGDAHMSAFNVPHHPRAPQLRASVWMRWLGRSFFRNLHAFNKCLRLYV